MKPTTVNLVVQRGASYDKGYQWLDRVLALSTDLDYNTLPLNKDGKPYRLTPRNLTGCTFKMQVRAEKSFPASPVLAEFSTVNGKIVSSSTDMLLGKWRINLSTVNTTALQFETAVYDIDITFPSGDLFTPVEGVFEPEMKVTL